MSVTMSDMVEIARTALAALTPADTIGDLVDRTTEDEGVTTLSFAANLAGYPGWHWSVSVAELPGEEPTVLEAELMPGDGALLAPDWVPWAERLEEYRVAQAAAAAELGEAESSDSDDDESDDDSDDNDADFDEDDVIDDDVIDDDVIDDDDLAVSASGDDEQDEAESESADDGPEHPDEA